MPELNLPLARKVYEHITQHPDEFEMDDWGHRTACGTTMCIAGHAVSLAGHEIAWDISVADRTGVFASHLVDGREIEAVAAKELGLEPQHRNLFWTTNRHAPAYLADLIRAAEERECSAVTSV